ncbi:MAG: hypothetical protein MMC23_002841 [Stictis urceolatum]|nr:hypothetical protein [Stictis urceolata]
MHILVTGAAGFVGQAFAKKLLDDDGGRYTVRLTDIVEPPIPQGVKWPPNATCISADLCVDCPKVVSKDLDAVYIFHGIMSSGAEANFDLGFKVNFDATRALIDELRKTSPGVRVIYASTHAVYSGQSQDALDESVLPTPLSSYGTQKIMCEYLINEYTRRSFINGLVLRFPTVTVRPGKPTQAASSFYSGIVREPMNGLECVVPTTDRSFRHWVCSPQILVENLMHCLDLSMDKLGDHRVINHPGICVSVQDMIDSLERVGGSDKLRFLREEEDPEVTPILYSWPYKYDNAKAMALGFKQDSGFDEIVRDYVRTLQK